MEFHVDGIAAAADMAAIATAIQTIDPAAVIDIDPETHALRVSAALQPGDLARALSTSGHPVDPLQIMQLPSNCCGGCGG